jgi:hypothetical protein
MASATDDCPRDHHHLFIYIKVKSGRQMLARAITSLHEVQVW